MGGVIKRPKTEAGVRGAAAKIDFVASEHRVLLGNVPIDAGHAEILGCRLRAYKVVDADFAVGAGQEPSVGLRVKGQHRSRSRIHYTRSAAVVLDKVWTRHVIHRGGIQQLPNSLIVHEEEYFVLFDRPAEGAAILVSAEFRHRSAVKEAAAIEGAVPEEFISRTMEIVRARF